MAIKRASDNNRANLLARLNTLHYYVVNEISWEVRKLTKYIAVQRIAEEDLQEVDQAPPGLGHQ